MSDIKIPIEIETKGAGKAKGDINGVTSSVEDLGKSADKTGDQLKEMIKQTAAFAGLSLGAAGLKEFGSKLIDVRKEMQGYSTSLNVLLGDQEKANAMFAELKEFAVTTPLMLKDLASGAQTMLGFNIEAEKVVPTLKAIGDISMGDSQRFQSLTLAFSQMSATGKLMGQDLLQMINAGFNPLMEISRKTGKSISELKDEMSNGAISAQMVADAFMSATQEGGQFYGMIAAQGKTLAGQINTLKGAIDDMFNTLGEQGEGIISGTVSALTTLVQNYEKVGKAIVTLVASYGAYKAALIATDVLVLANARGSAIALSALKELVLSTKAATAAQAAFNAVAKMNPYVLLASAVVAAVGVVWTLSDSLDQATVAQNNLNRSIEDFDSKQKEQKETAESLISVLQDQTKTDSQRARAYKQLSEVCAELTNKYSQEELSVMSLTEAYRALNEVQEQGRAKKLQGDTETLVRVYNDLLRVSKGQQSVGSAETQAFIKANGLTGMDPKKVRDMLRSQINKNQEELSSYNNNPPGQKEEVKNKEYWEKQKNDAQKELDALTDIEAKGSKGAALRKKIAEYQSKIDIYSVSKNSGKDSSKNAAHLAEVERRQAIDAERFAVDERMKTTQAEIDAMEEGGDKVLAQLDLNYQKELEAIRREQEDLLAEREKNAKELWEADNASLVKKGATWEGSKEQADFQSKNELTEEDKAYFEARTKAATAAHERGVEAQTDADRQYMYQYLQQYGTLQQQKDAIFAQYEEKIKKANQEGNVWMAKSLQEEMKKAISDIDTNAFKLDINWEAVFGDLSKYTTKQLKVLKQQLETYKLSDNYVQGTEENKKVIDEALSNINDSIISGSGIFGGLGEALNQLAAAEQELAEAEEDLLRASDEEAKEAAKKRKNKAQQGVDNAEANVSKASDNAVNNITSLANTITQLGTQSEMTLSDLGNLAQGIASAFGEAGKKVGGLIGAIFAIAEMVAKDGIRGLFNNIGKLIGQVIGGILGIDIDKSTHEYEKQKEIHDNYIQMLDRVISKQEELMDRQGAMDAINTAKDTEDYYREIQRVRGEDIKGWLNSGASSGFLGIGSSASEGRKARESIFGGWNSGESGAYRYGAEHGLSGEELLKQKRLYDAYIQIFGQMSGRLEELGSASVEQIKLVQKNIELWNSLPSEVTDYYLQILDSEDAIDGLNKKLVEINTGTTFDSLRDNFASSLMDMEKDTQSFANDFSKMMMQAALNSKVKEVLGGQLEEWQNEWNRRMTDDGMLDDNDIKDLQKIWDDIVKQGIDIRDTIAKTTGYDKDQGKIAATTKSVSGMSEDTGNAMVGGIVSISMSNHEISMRVADGVSELRNVQAAINGSTAVLNDINVAVLAANGLLSQVFDAISRGNSAIESAVKGVTTAINAKL